MSSVYHEENVSSQPEYHESYGMLEITKAQCTPGMPLFGSSIKHSDIITLKLMEGSQRRRNNTNYYYSGKRLFEIDMSYSQYAQLLTSIGQGGGTPVTIKRRVDKEGLLPPCPYENKVELHRKEFDTHLRTQNQAVNGLIDELTEKFGGSKPLNKSEKNEIISMLEKLKQNLNENASYMVSAFNEQIENTVSEAKGEMEAFWQDKINQIAAMGIANSDALGIPKTKPVAMLDENDET